MLQAVPEKMHIMQAGFRLKIIRKIPIPLPLQIPVVPLYRQPHPFANLNIPGHHTRGILIEWFYAYFR
jgi:hypothetical protein